VSTKRVEEIWKTTQELAETLGCLDAELANAMGSMMLARSTLDAMKNEAGVESIDDAADAVTTVRLVLALLKWEREDETSRRRVISVRTT